MATGDLLARLQQFLGGQSSAQGNQAIQQQLAAQAPALPGGVADPNVATVQSARGIVNPTDFDTEIPGGGTLGDDRGGSAVAEGQSAEIIGINGQGIDQGQGNAVGSTYTVQPGDNLWSIAQRFLGSGLRFAEIAKLNGIPNPDLIIPGMQLQIPTGEGQVAPLPERNPVRGAKEERQVAGLDVRRKLPPQTD